MKIIKRDGREVPYDYEKIKNAIDGTYSISGVELTVVMAGHSLKYDTYKVADDSLTLTDHGTETVLSKYTGKVNK